MSIRVKAVLIFLALSLVPLSLVGWLAYRQGEEMIRQGLVASFQRLARETITTVDRHLSDVSHNVQTWANLEVMQEVITGDVDGKISSFLMGLHREYGSFVHLSALNAAGQVVASSDPSLEGRDFSQDECARAVEGTPVLGDVRVSPVSQRWVLTFAFPIQARFAPRRPIGALCANWKAEELQALTQSTLISDQRFWGRVLLLRRDGLLIATPDTEQQDRFVLNLRDAGWESARRASEGQRGHLIERDQGGRAALISYDSSGGYRDFPGWGWIILVVQDVRAAFAPIDRLKLLVVQVGVVVALCVVAISWLLMRRMTRPILEIARAASRVARGDFDSQVRSRSHDELGTLARGFNQMVQDLKRQRAQLVEKAYVDNILRSMMNALVVVDPNGRIRTVNRAACELLGYQEEELVGQPAARIFAPEARPPWTDGMREPPPAMTNVESAYKAKDGRIIPVLFSSAVLEEGAGSFQGVVCVAQDITERKQAEEALQQNAKELARSNAELEQFAYVASHDLQEPLRVVAAYTQLLAKRYQDKLDADAETFITFVVDGVKRMQTLISDLLAYSRVGTRGERLIPVAVGPILKTVLANLQVAIQESGAVVEYDGLPVVIADPLQLGQVFQNLLSNAIKFHGPEPPRIRVAARPEGREWVFAVHDNGIGIDPQYAQRIFVIFQRLHTPDEYPGTGIGLAICKKIIERHGGRIWVESRPGQGATFSFTLPAVDT